MVTRQMEAQPELRLNFRLDAQPRPLCFTGRLDASSVADVRSALNAVIEATETDVAVDLSGVDIVDATGLGVLAAAHVRLEREGRRLVIRGCSAQLHRILVVTRLLRVLHLEHV